MVISKWIDCQLSHTLASREPSFISLNDIFLLFWVQKVLEIKINSIFQDEHFSCVVIYTNTFSCSLICKHCYKWCFVGHVILPKKSLNCMGLEELFGFLLLFRVENPQSSFHLEVLHLRYFTIPQP